MSIDQTLEQIEEVLKRMEEGELSLEESFQCYAHGMELIKQCEGQIGTIEKKVRQITETGEIDEFQ